MTTPMTHEEAQDLLAAEALEALSGAERDALLAHITTCMACERALGELRDAAGELAYAVVHAPLAPARNKRVRARLLARAAADAGTRATSRVTPVRSSRAAEPFYRSRPITGWLIAAGITLLAFGASMAAVRYRRVAGAMGQQVALTQHQRDSLQQDLTTRDQTLAEVFGPSVRVIELVAATPQSPSGRMFWDQATNRWTFVAHHLAQTPQGRAYELWLITPDQQKHPAGMFLPDANGKGFHQATFALARDSLSAVAVTEEPSNGVPSPTGPIVIVGTAR